MPALVFNWNLAGFNGISAIQNCHNDVAGQIQVVIIANFIANGAIQYTLY